MELYQNPNKPEQQGNIDDFNAIRKRFDWLEFFHPQPEKSPWHVKAVLGFDEQGRPTIHLNFWPHTGRAQRDQRAVVSGYEEVRRMIAEAIDDSTQVDIPEEFDVIEG